MIEHTYLDQVDPDEAEAPDRHDDMAAAADEVLPSWEAHTLHEVPRTGGTLGAILAATLTGAANYTEIARIIGRGKRTVRNYLREAETDPVTFRARLAREQAKASADVRQGALFPPDASIQLPPTRRGRPPGSRRIARPATLQQSLF